MTSSQTHERRPVTTDEAAPAIPATGRNYPSIVPADALELLAVLVVRELVNGGTRRTVVRSLNTAEKHVERAHAAGCAAELRLVRLVPVELTDAAAASLEGGGCE